MLRGERARLSNTIVSFVHIPMPMVLHLCFLDSELLFGHVHHFILIYVVSLFRLPEHSGRIKNYPVFVSCDRISVFLFLKISALFRSVSGKD